MTIGDYSDKILQFDPQRMAWIMRNETLGHGKTGFFMIDVPKEDYCF